MDGVMTREWLRIAHRGASGSAPEHTPAAFRRALEIGVDMIELDVQLSRDGQLIVIHDFHLGRTTDGSGAVQDLDWATLRQFDSGTWFSPEYAGQRIMTLGDVVDLVDRRARLNVEMKVADGARESLARKVVRFLAERDLLSTTIVSSFDLGALRAARAESEAVAVGILTHEPDLTPSWAAASELRAVSIHPYWAFVTSEAIERSHAEGLDVIVWTVNEVDAMEALVAQGVDGIISDYPERFSLVGTSTG
jgi:glycerophosphoryl diester phosphodiesterase